MVKTQRRNNVTHSHYTRPQKKKKPKMLKLKGNQEIKYINKINK